MANIQDIHALEERIYDAVQEYLDNPDGYENATLHVYLDEDDMELKETAQPRTTNYERKQKFGNSNPCRWWLWSACGTCRVLPLSRLGLIQLEMQKTFDNCND